jgi:hypothetical protein
MGLEIVVVLPGNEQVTDVGARVFAERCRSRPRGRPPGGTGVPAVTLSGAVSCGPAAAVARN